MTTTAATREMTGRPLPRPRARENFRLIRQLFDQPASVLDHVNVKYGPACLLGAGPMKVAVIGGPALIHQIFTTPAESFRWAHKFNVIGLRFFIGRSSMIVSDGEDHQRRRAAVQQAFARRRLNGWIPMIIDRVDEAVERLTALLSTDGEAIDLYPHGRRLILGITLHAFFGPRLAERVDEIGDLYERPQRYIEAPGVKQLPHPIPFTARSRVRSDRKAIDRMIDAEVADRRRRDEADPLDVLDAVIRSGTLSDGEIRDQVRTLIGAGYDTSASALAWMLLRAAGSPGVWDRLRAEADDVLGRVDDRVDGERDGADPETLARLVFAGRVVRESLRLHPAGLLGVRLAAVDVPVGDYTIPHGTLIAWSPYLAGRDAETWAEPRQFNPDRFANLTPEQQASSDRAWVPFGWGPHSCIGFALAQMELTLTLARLAQRLDLAPISEVVPRPVGMIVNRPEGGARLLVARRSQV